MTDDEKPTNVHWLNYWAPEIQKKTNINRLKEIKKKYEQFAFNDGFVKLQDIPLNAENEKDIKYKSEIEAKLL